MFRRLFFGTLAALLVGTAGVGLATRSASAEVVRNARADVIRSRDNPCEAGSNPIYLEGVVHFVWYTTPDGTLKMNIQGHLTGTDEDGTKYILNTQQHMEHWAWPTMTPYTDRVRLNLISKGSTVNALVVMTFDVPAGGAQDPTATATACVG